MCAVAWAALCVSLCGCQTVTQPVSSGTSDIPVIEFSEETNTLASYLLVAGDAIEIRFYDLPSQPPTFCTKVPTSGEIVLPFNITVLAAGKTTKELEKEIPLRYVPKHFPHLQVDVRRITRVFYVGGEVKAPGRFLYWREITIRRAIENAGDFTKAASQHKVSVIHADGRKETLDGMRKRHNSRSDPLVLPGDTIIVPRRFSFF